jgi:hypothetical protein
MRSTGRWLANVYFHLCCALRDKSRYDDETKEEQRKD